MPMRINLSPRLQAIANMIPAGSLPADIGSDHAYLSIALINSGRCSKVIAADINQGPLDAARKRVQKAGLNEQIDLRLGNGLDVLQKGEADVVICAGMGGELITEILDRGARLLLAIKRLVLQPNTRAGDLRLWLADNGWLLIDEDLILERKRYYQILAAEPGEMKLSQIEAQFGPVLIKKKHPLLKSLIHRNMEAINTSLEQMQRAKNPAHEKIKQLHNLYQEMEALLTCL